MKQARLMMVSAMLLSGAVAAGAAEFSMTGVDEKRAHVNFLLHCAACHLPDGHGSAGKVPDLREYLGEFAQHPASRSFIARVPGASGAPINDKELADVLNWILLTMNGEQLRPDFKPYTADEVAGYRRDVLTDVEPVRRELITTLAAGR